jgi:peroxiredoxin
MLKLPWSLERMLITGCVLGLLVIIPIASVLSHRNAPQPVSSAPEDDDSPPDASDVPQVLQTGSLAPAFDSTTVDGHPFTSKDLKGHVAVLDFWATWCGPCRMAIPALQDIQTNYSSKGVQVVGVSMDTDTAKYVKPYAARMNMTYPLLVNPDRNIAAAQLYDAGSLPSVYVIDKHGKVRWSVSGYFPGEEDVLTHLIDRLLKER